MKSLDEKKLLPRNRVRFSKGVLVLSLSLLVGGLAMSLGPWPSGRIPGMVCASLSLVVFFTAGCYWGCKNESCS